ncbi:MAG: DNA primase [Nitrospinota bacterium]|nr:DNA primase [Nitrospinota bacterium]MDH5755468.1 DNA primase [Nitrospinota bacterium]
MNAIPQGTIDEVRGRADIVEVISGYIPLKKAGANYRALCPFHEETTPSFNVNPDKGFFHCFGCGEGGNSISFVMKYESVSFPEAVRLLAKRYGVVIPESGAEGGKPGLTERIYAAMEAAQRFYRKRLVEAPQDSAPVEYLKKRGVAPEAQELFGIGWAPDQWDALTTALLAGGFDKKILETAGLAKESSKGNLIDRFRARVMFPVRDMQGRPIAFGGRIVAESSDAPKYINSPETPIYNKSRVLFGLNLAAPMARKQNHLVIVEGYMDVVALRSAGIENCVAVSGTAFTAPQAEAIKRMCDEVTAFFDSDKAGLAAAKKSLPVLLDKGLKVKVLNLAEAKDADEVLKEQGAAELERLLGAAPTFAQFIIDSAAQSADISTVEGKAQAAREAMPYINRIQDRIMRDQYTQILAEKVGIDLELIKSEAAAMASGAPRKAPLRPAAPKKAPPRQGARAAAERIVIRILLDRPDYLDGAAAGLEAENFLDEENRRLFLFISQAAQGGAKNIEAILEVARAAGLEGKITDRSMESNLYDEKGADKAIADCILALRYRPDERKESLQKLIQQAGGGDKGKFDDAKKDYIKSRENRIV